MGETSIPCQEETRDRLRDDKTSGVSWDRYLNDLLDDAQAAVDEGVASAPAAGDDVEKVLDAVESVPERTADELEGRFR